MPVSREIRLHKAYLGSFSRRSVEHARSLKPTLRRAPSRTLGLDTVFGRSLAGPAACARELCEPCTPEKPDTGEPRRLPQQHPLSGKQRHDLEIGRNGTPALIQERLPAIDRRKRLEPRELVLAQFAQSCDCEHGIKRRGRPMEVPRRTLGGSSVSAVIGSRSSSLWKKTRCEERSATR